MSIAAIMVALFLVLFGVNALGWVAVSSGVLGLVAFVAGLVVAVDGAGVFTYRIGRKL